MDIQKYSREELSDMGLMTLREMAKLYDLPCATNTKKADLVEELIKIQNGILPPPKKKQGRPRKNDPSFFLKLTPPAENENSGGGTENSDSTYRTDQKEQPENSYRKNKKGEGDVKSASLSAREEEFTVENSEIREGIFEQNTNANYGFVRNHSLPNADAFLSYAQIRKFNIKNGDKIKGYTPIRQGESNNAPPMWSIIEINSLPPDKHMAKPSFDTLVPIFPNSKLTLEDTDNPTEYALRLIDLISPIGKGQRGLIVSPPKAGKTTLLRNIALSLEKNHPECKVFVLLIDERPEEVTDMKYSLKSEVIASTFDTEPENHIKCAERVLAMAKSLVEAGQDVIILLDSLTRLTRTCNNTLDKSGKILSGGMDSLAFLFPKQFFGAARNIENGGSLTIIATCLVDTNSRMDEVIYEELKGTGNMEIHLDRKLSEKRVFPAIDIVKSGTRHEDLLLNPYELEAIRSIRKLLYNEPDSTEKLLNLLTSTKSNMEFVSKVIASTKQAAAKKDF